jgi:DNA-binding HxlR family transcriptional regulator
MEYAFRSDCPINFALEIFGDKWSLLIVRDIVFANKATYGDFLESNEKIATNILSSRLKRLEETGIIEKRHDSTRKTRTKVIYGLTQRGAELIPILIELMLWSGKQRELDEDARTIIDKAKQDKQALIKELHQKVIT